MSLEDGDISVGDINNDGSNDFIFTGENITGNPVTKLFLEHLVVKKIFRTAPS